MAVNVLAKIRKKAVKAAYDAHTANVVDRVFVFEQKYAEMIVNECITRMWLAKKTTPSDIEADIREHFKMK